MPSSSNTKNSAQAAKTNSDKSNSVNINGPELATESELAQRAGAHELPAQARLQQAIRNPSSASTASILQLQRLVGNQAVANLLNRQTGAAPMPIQRRLHVGPANDRYEQEADSIAAQVRTAPISAQRTPIGPDGGRLDHGLEGKIRQAQNGGSSMSGSIRSKLEPKLGADLSGVKIHANSQSAQLSRDLGAKAFTIRNHIFYGANQSPSDMSLTAHEAVHTVQQGAVPRTHRKIDAEHERADTTANGPGVVQLKRDVNADKAALNDVRTKVIIALTDGKWPEAMKAYTDVNIQYQKSGWWGGTKLAKWGRGTLALDPDRKKAKALIADTTKSSDQKLLDIKAIANSTYNLSRPSNFKDGDLHHVGDMITKIAYYLVEALPSGVRQLAQHMANIAPDLGGVLGEDVNRGDPGAGVKSTKVKSDERSIKQSITSGGMDNRGFHGSASWLLEGLGKSGGKLLSQKAAFDAGLLKTGEGTTFSSGASLKTNVYIGKGETGFGTAASYAMAPAALASYNVSLYSDVELAQTIADYRRIIHLQVVLDEMDPTTSTSGKSLLIHQILEQAKLAGIDPGVDSGYAHMPKLQSVVQLRDMLGKLEREVEDRKKWPGNDQRRQGGLLNPDNYPILLEFDLTGITSTDDFGAQQREARGDYRLAGEATVADEIDLTNGRLKFVYVPEQFIGKTYQKLNAVFGSKHGIRVRSLEAIKGGVVKGGKAEKTISATYGQLEKQQKSLDVKLRAQKYMAGSMLDYVDKNNKDALHNSITKIMSDGIAPIDVTDTPEALLMMGGPGSGKSTIINMVLDPKELKNMVVADPDAIKNMLPSYQAGVAKGDTQIASKVHGESKKVNASLVDQTILGRRNLLYDATGANKKEYTDLIQKLKHAGYKVHLVLTQLDVEEGVKRVKERERVTGRGVPENIVRSVYRAAPRNFAALVPQVDNALVFDNSGDKPVLLWSTDDGSSVDPQELLELKGKLDIESD